MSKPGKLKIALVSMKHRLGDPAFNLDRHHTWIERCLETDADFIGFPEFSLTGWTYERSEALTLQSAPLRQIADWARRYKVFIATCLTEKAGKRLHNTSVIYGPKGRVGLMRKINLVGQETRNYTPGRAFGVFDVAGCRMGITTCADASWHEMFRVLSLRGAEVIFAPHANTLPHYGGTPSAWLRWRKERWPLFARECGVVIAGVNNAGLCEKLVVDPEETVYCGGGGVFDWEGQVISQARVRIKKECLIVADLDLAALREGRRKVLRSQGFRADIVYNSKINELTAVQD